MEKIPEKCCSNCKYFRIQEEYWHDHYRIPEHKYCEYHSRCNEYEVKSTDCCKNFVLWEVITRN